MDALNHCLYVPQEMDNDLESEQYETFNVL